MNIWRHMRRLGWLAWLVAVSFAACQPRSERAIEFDKPLTNVVPRFGAQTTWLSSSNGVILGIYVERTRQIGAHSLQCGPVVSNATPRNLNLWLRKNSQQRISMVLYDPAGRRVPYARGQEGYAITPESAEDVRSREALRRFRPADIQAHEASIPDFADLLQVFALKEAGTYRLRLIARYYEIIPPNKMTACGFPPADVSIEIPPDVLR